MGQACLLIIDLQQEFTRRTAAGIPRSNPGAEGVIASVLARARDRGMPVIHIHHDDPRPTSGFRLDKPGGAPMDCAAPAPGETVIVKHGSSAMSGTGLADHLTAHGLTDLIVIGASVNYCVSSTVRAACDLGFGVTVVSDAVFGFGTTDPDGRVSDPATVLSVTLGTLSDFATVTTAAELF